MMKVVLKLPMQTWLMIKEYNHGKLKIKSDK
jgi:hypothetical protein